MKSIIKPYKKDYEYSYTSGAYATIELIRARPEQVETVYIHSRFNEPGVLEAICARHNIPVERSDKVFQRINQKENAYVLGVFRKYPCAIGPEVPHVALVNPADAGNLGTIVRTLAGLGMGNLAIITPAVDIWNPKTIRASMGAVFRMRFEHFGSIGAYRQRFPEHHLYTFMLDGEVELRPAELARRRRYTLVFGNEASGLDDSFAGLGTSVRIPQPGPVDSFNLAAAVAIGAYVFSL